MSLGVLAGLMVCGLVLLLVSGSARMHAWYVLACGFALAGFALLDRLSPDVPRAHWAALLLMLWAGCRLEFSRQLLRLPKFTPRLDRVALGFLAGLALAALYCAIEARLPWLLRVLQALVAASTVTLVAGAISVRRRAPWPALLFCVGAALLLAGVSAAHLPAWGVAPWTPGHASLAQAAVIAELALLAVAAAMRIREERAVEAHAQSLLAAPGIDALTGAASEAGFELRCDEWLREDRSFSLMLIGLNDFDAVYERHGQTGGDAVLAAIAHRLREQLRADDMVARLGADSFAILLVGVPPRQKLAEMAIRIETAGARPVAYEGRLLAGGELSMGIASHPGDGDTLGSLLEAAERALAHCKRQRMGPAYAFASELGRTA
ncbi:diguanylate cyclase (GGDEF)-like protein [Variovorax paradoxus]|uniref:sensor domain-containing diguanylate cyclase n=1 Tax=Variovorax atrisoli TaxID=3394203 RepID=UPI00119B2BF4|nr:GGDEF domain-containing protein [Variovorax paradoxus]MDR6519568.1 diguanylate cyclase (GGDEF)-like protein [Variovorax paradoxus]